MTKTPGARTSRGTGRDFGGQRWLYGGQRRSDGGAEPPKPGGRLEGTDPESGFAHAEFGVLALGQGGRGWWSRIFPWWGWRGVPVTSGGRRASGPPARTSWNEDRTRARRRRRINVTSATASAESDRYVDWHPDSAGDHRGAEPPPV